MRSILLHLARTRENCHRVHETVVSCALETMFGENALRTPQHAKAMAREAIRTSHGPRVEGKRAKKVRKLEHPRDIPRFQECQRSIHQVRVRSLFVFALEHAKSETRQETHASAQMSPTDNSYTENAWFDDGWSFDDSHADWSSVRWYEGWEEPYENCGNSFYLGSFFARCSEQSESV